MNMQGKKWGDETGHGYLYTEFAQPRERELYLAAADWLPTRLGEEEVVRRGLYSGGAKRNQILTPYAGIGKYVRKEHATFPECAYYNSLMHGAIGEMYVIDGFRSPVEGYGLAQFANHSDDRARRNAKYEKIRTVGTRTHDKTMGIYLKATRDIEPGEEILVDYGQDYFRRPVDRGGEGKRKALPTEAENKPLKRTLQFEKMDVTPTQVAGIRDAHVEKIGELNGVRYLGLDGVISNRALDMNPKLREVLEARTSSGRTVQVLMPDEHWVIAERYKGAAVKIYDPGYTTGGQGAIFRLCARVFHTKRIDIAYGMQRGANREECRLLAMAVLLDLTQGKHEPEERIYDIGAGGGPLLNNIVNNQVVRPIPSRGKETERRHDTHPEREAGVIPGYQKMGITDIWKEIKASQQEISVIDRHVWAFQDLEQALMENLHLTQVANGQVALIKQGMRWHSNVKLLTHIGAVGGTKEAFLHDSYTLVRYLGGRQPGGQSDIEIAKRVIGRDKGPQGSA